MAAMTATPITSKRHYQLLVGATLITKERLLRHRFRSGKCNHYRDHLCEYLRPSLCRCVRVPCRRAWLHRASHTRVWCAERTQSLEKNGTIML